MLELKNANKYFNKGKKNQIHVINHTTLSLEDHGLVALLGPSGCGKTTLLNVIGGLDKIKSGSIYVNNQKISARCIRKVDKIRNLNIGYIFQDYKLIENLSVYDNVAIVLKMIGIKDKLEIKTRVEYVLEKVGMLRYQKRPANMLSGGERQRVGIARAIVKDPNIILADEPTGNLDSKNSLEIMNIIKAISKERLVILVTHEQNLAKFYASRIIEIGDGSIKNDYENIHEQELDYEIDNRFYLKDFSNITNLTDKEKTHEIKIYQNEEAPVKLTIVVKNGNIYIQSPEHRKLEIVDENSNIEFLDQHYKKIDQKEVEAYQFHFQEIINQNVKKKYSSITSLFRSILNGFKNILDFPILKKLLLIGFFLSGMFIMYSISTIAAAINIKDESFVTTNKDYLILSQSKNSVADYLEYEKNDDINYLLIGDSKVTFTIPYDDYYQTNRGSGSLQGSLSSIDSITESDLIDGRMPENSSEIVVDKMAITKMYEQNDNLQMAGLIKVQDMLDRTATISHMKEFTIVGITDQKSPNIYTSPSLFVNIIANTKNRSYPNYGIYYTEDISQSDMNGNLIDYTLYQDKIELKKGRMPVSDYEIIVNLINEKDMPLNKQIKTEVNGTKLTVVGYYTSKYGYQTYFTNQNTIQYQLITSAKNITIYPKDKEKVLDYFQNQNKNIKDSYNQSKNEYINQKKEEIKSTLFVSGIILVISLIEIFFMIRSSFLSRIKEIGILRAIGVKKSDIYKMFAGEIVAITTFAGMPGLILMAYMLSVLSKVKYLSNYFIITPMIVLLSVLFLYLFNFIIGSIPVYHTIRKRPAEILSRYDLD